MSQAKTFGAPPPARPAKILELQAMSGDPVSRFYAEDGWIFREYPGKSIELVCRYDRPSAAYAQPIQAQTAEA